MGWRVLLLYYCMSGPCLKAGFLCNNLHFGKLVVGQLGHHSLPRVIQAGCFQEVEHVRLFGRDLADRWLLGFLVLSNAGKSEHARL